MPSLAKFNSCPTKTYTDQIANLVACGFTLVRTIHSVTANLLTVTAPKMARGTAFHIFDP